MTTEYGMFTEAGNREIDKIVDFARQYRLSRTQVITALELFANDNPDFAEATDTVVRERVWEELKYATHE